MENVYIPKGSMCISCHWKDHRCNTLPFKDMQVLEAFRSDYYGQPCMLNIVRCTHFTRPGDTNDHPA